MNELYTLIEHFTYNKESNKRYEIIEVLFKDIVDNI